MAADGLSASKRRSYKEDSDSSPSESDEEEAHDPFAGGDLDDPTIVDSTGQLNRAGWALNQRNRWESHPKLPHELAKQLGRRCIPARCHSACICLWSFQGVLERSMHLPCVWSTQSIPRRQLAHHCASYCTLFKFM